MNYDLITNKDLYVEKVRSDLFEKIKKTAEEKKKKLLLKDSCDHNFKKYKQSIRRDNLDFQGNASFIVLGCDKCHGKRIVGYIIE